MGEHPPSARRHRAPGHQQRVGAGVCPDGAGWCKAPPGRAGPAVGTVPSHHCHLSALPCLCLPSPPVHPGDADSRVLLLHPKVLSSHPDGPSDATTGTHMLIPLAWRSGGRGPSGETRGEGGVSHQVWRHSDSG